MADNKMDVNIDTSEEWFALRNAVINREPEVILNLLKRNVDFRCTDPDGNTVLHLGFKKFIVVDDQPLLIEILNMFLDRGMNPNAMNNEGKTVMHLAIKFRLRDVIEFLLTKGALLNIRDDDGDSTAHFMVDNAFEYYCKNCWSANYYNNQKTYAKDKGKEFIRWLLSKGLLVNYRNNNGIIPLHLAAQLNLQFVMVELMDYTIDYYAKCVNTKHQNILHSLFESFQKTNPIGLKNQTKSRSIPFNEEEMTLSDIVKSLMDKGVSIDAVDENGNTPFHLALKLAEIRIANLMVEKFTNFEACDSDGNTVLHIIVMNARERNFDIYKYVKILLSRGANVHIRNNDGLVPLQIAVLKNRTNLVNLFKKAGADFLVSHKNGNLIHFFTTKTLKCMGRGTASSTIEMLVSEGCDINGINDYGMTPLHLALRSCNTNVVDTLIELGADVRAQELSETKYTTLHLAVIYGYETHIDCFINAGVDINAQAANGRSALHYATDSKNTKVMRKFLELGALVDQYDYEGNSPLHMALRHENIEGVITLLNHGADVDDINTKNEVECLIVNKTLAIIIIRHWMKLKYARLPVMAASKDWIDTYYRINGSSLQYESIKFRRNCDAEIGKLKEGKIEGNVSWYDFLHLNRNRQSAFVKHHDVKKKLLNCQFPIYEPVISGAYHQAKIRIPLLRSALYAWYELTNHCLPDICVEHIYSFLSNANLRDLVKSVEN